MNNSNILVVEKYFSSLAKGDLETLGGLLADDVIWHQPGQGKLSKTYYGKSEVFELFGKFMAISQNSFKIDSVLSIMANGPFVAAQIHFSAKKSGGQSISMDGIDLMKIEKNKIKEVFLFSADGNAEDSFWT